MKIYASVKVPVITDQGLRRYINSGLWVKVYNYSETMQGPGYVFWVRLKGDPATGEIKHIKAVHDSFVVDYEYYFGGKLPSKIVRNSLDLPLIRLYTPVEFMSEEDMQDIITRNDDIYTESRQGISFD